MPSGARKLRSAGEYLRDKSTRQLSPPPSNASELAALDPLTWLKCKVCSCFLLFVVQQTALVYLHKNAAWRCSTHQVVTCATLSPIPLPQVFGDRSTKLRRLGDKSWAPRILRHNPKGKTSKSKVLCKRCKILPTFWTISDPRPGKGTEQDIY